MPTAAKGKGWKGKKRAKLYTRINRILIKHADKGDPTVAIALALIKSLDTRSNWYRHGDGIYTVRAFLVSAGLMCAGPRG